MVDDVGVLAVMRVRPRSSLKPLSYEFTVVTLYLRGEYLFDTSEVLDNAQQEGMNPAPDTIIMTRGFQVIAQELSKTAWHQPNELPYWKSFMGASGTWVPVSCDK